MGTRVSKKKSKRKYKLYPKGVIDLLVNKDPDEPLADAVKRAHVAFPSVKNQLTVARAYAVIGWQRKKAELHKSGLAKSQSAKPESVPAQLPSTDKRIHFSAASPDFKQRILVVGLSYKEQGKTPTSIRELLSEKFPGILFPPARKLSQHIAAFMNNGTTPNGDHTDQGKEYTVVVKGPGTEVTRSISSGDATALLSYLFGGRSSLTLTN